MSIGQFHIPAEAVRREYAVYVIVARHRQKKRVHFYVGKTGDNREGCNPVISRAGNHLSFNPLHAQSRNHLGNPEAYDFDFFFTSFGRYQRPSTTRRGIDLVNEMERQLNFLAQELLGEVINPLKGTGYVSPAECEKRKRLATPARVARLKELIQHVRQFVAKGAAK